VRLLGRASPPLRKATLSKPACFRGYIAEVERVQYPLKGGLHACQRGIAHKVEPVLTRADRLAVPRAGTEFA